MNDEMERARELYNPFASEEVIPAHSEHWEAKRRVAQAVRELTEALVTSAPPAQALVEIAEDLEQQVRTLSGHKRLFGLMSFLKDGEHGEHGELNHELNGVGGWSNPLSPGLNMWIEGNRAYGTVNCGYAYEGPPEHIHGGHVAAIFDQFLGMAQLAGEHPGMTGTLTLRYLKPTPLNTDLDLEAEVNSLQGRKTIVHGKIINKGVVTATCEGLFVRPTKSLDFQTN